MPATAGSAAIRARARNALLVAVMLLPQSACLESGTTTELHANGSSSVLGAPDAAERLYLEGILPSGQTMDGVVQGDVPLRGEQLVCSNCHGRSGMGSTEGSIVTPAIAGAVLYAAEEVRRKELYSSRTIRPPYTDASLKRAIREGIDVNGNELDAMMPRYSLNDEDLNQLVAYLKTLSASPSPGVTDTTIHFATVITNGVEPSQREALLEVLAKFFELKNAGTRQELRRAENAPFHKAWRYESYRQWDLHIWELSGPDTTWAEQLQAHYEKQPVFAMISGLGAGSWRPVHEFCENTQLPCLLPNTNMPVVSESDYYTLYFSRGVSLAADTIARHITKKTADTGPVIQVYRTHESAVVAAELLRHALESRGFTELRDRRVANDEEITTEFWRDLLKGNKSVTLVLWLGDQDRSGINLLDEVDTGSGSIYLWSSMLTDAPSTIEKNLHDRLYLVYPYDLPGDSAGRLQHNNFWLRQNKIEIRHAPLQANTLFTAMLASQALKHLGSNFYREYFLEKIEHSIDSMSSLASYRNLSLAKNQRYASKGCYVLTLAEGLDGNIAMDGDWIVP